MQLHGDLHPHTCRCLLTGLLHLCLPLSGCQDLLQRCVEGMAEKLGAVDPQDCAAVLRFCLTCCSKKNARGVRWHCVWSFANKSHCSYATLASHEYCAFDSYTCPKLMLLCRQPQCTAAPICMQVVQQLRQWLHFVSPSDPRLPVAPDPSLDKGKGRAGAGTGASIEERMMAELVAGLQLNPAAAAAMLDEVQVGAGRFWAPWQSYSLFVTLLERRR